MRIWALAISMLLSVAGVAQAKPSWSHGANDAARAQGFVFRVDDLDNIPDLHGNPQPAEAQAACQAFGSKPCAADIVP